MKKPIALLLAAVMLLSLAACSETWTCPSCGEKATNNFCSNCGQAREASAADSDAEATAAETKPTGGTYQLLSDLPDLFTERRLSEEEAAELKNADLETLREKISTPADFAAWIDTQDGAYMSNIKTDPNGQRTYGADFAFSGWPQGFMGTPQAASLAVRILGDDIPGIGQLAAVMDYDGGVILSGTVIPADGGYYVYSLDYETQHADPSRHMDERIPLIFTEKLENLVSFFGSADDPSAQGGTLTQLFYFPKDEQVALNLDNGAYVADGSAEELYRDDEYLNSWEERTYGHVKPENIGSYELSSVLGGTTLTAEEAYALLDCTPEEVKERVKTAGDMLMYMLAARIGDCGGDRTKTVSGKEWHYNLNAFEVMEQRLGNCGSAANLANYLLEGDYEEVGFILHAYYIGNGGGHVYNYFLYEGSYYIVDFSWYIFANYEPSNDFHVVKLSKLEDYKDQVNNVYGGVCMALAHTSTGQHLPNVFDDAAGKYAIPEGAEYKLLYQETGSNCYQLAEYPLDRSQLDWTTYDGATDSEESGSTAEQQTDTDAAKPADHTQTEGSQTEQKLIADAVKAEVGSEKFAEWQTLYKNEMGSAPKAPEVTAVYHYTIDDFDGEKMDCYLVNISADIFYWKNEEAGQGILLERYQIFVSADGKTVMDSISTDAGNFNGDTSTSEGRATYLLWIFWNMMDGSYEGNFRNDSETVVEWSADGLATINANI